MNYATTLETRHKRLALAVAALKAKEEAERLESSLIEFHKAAWPTIDAAPYVHGWHLEAIAEHLEAVSRGVIRRLLVNIAPRHSKSLMCSVSWPSWTWANQKREGLPLLGPQVKFMCLAYAKPLALDHALIMRRLLESDWYQERWGSRVKLTSDQEAKSKFDTTAGGTRITDGFDGSLTGRGGDVRVIDDPHKADEAEGQTTREAVLRKYDGTLKSRITDPKHNAEVIIMQRLHESDLSGHILREKDPDLVHLVLPTEYEPNRSIVTKIGWKDPRTVDGEILWPERFGPKELIPFKRDPYSWAGQWQQRPEVRGGAIIKREWWQTWEGKWPRADFTLAALDSAYTEKAENDPSALTVWRCYTDKEGFPKIVLCAAWEKRLQLNGKTVARLPGESDADYRARASQEWGLVDWVADTCNELQVDRLLIEAKASGISVAQEIKRLHATKTWGVRLVDPKGRDKVARAHAVTSLFVDGLIYAPDRDWARAVIDQCAAFPKGAHDDLVDSAVYALDHLRSIGLAIRGEEHEREIAELMKPPERHEPVYEV